MKALPFSMPIQEARSFYLNGNEVLKILSPKSADVWPRQSNAETLIHDGNQRTLYSATTSTVFTGPKHGDWKQVITHVYDMDGNLVYNTDIKPYLDASTEAYNGYKKKRGRKTASITV